MIHRSAFARLKLDISGIENFYVRFTLTFLIYKWEIRRLDQLPNDSVWLQNIQPSFRPGIKPITNFSVVFSSKILSTKKIYSLLDKWYNQLLKVNFVSCSSVWNNSSDLTSNSCCKLAHVWLQTKFHSAWFIQHFLQLIIGQWFILWNWYLFLKQTFSTFCHTALLISKAQSRNGNSAIYCFEFQSL